MIEIDELRRLAPKMQALSDKMRPAMLCAEHEEASEAVGEAVGLLSALATLLGREDKPKEAT